MRKRSDVIADIVDNLRRAFQVVNEQSKKIEHETGLTGPQLWAIKTVSRKSPMMVSEIARRMHLHPATVVGILDRLEKQGLAMRIRSTEDRRVVKVTLTAKGSVIAGKSARSAQGMLVSRLEMLSASKLIKTARVLEQMAEILGAQKIPPRLLLSPKVNRPIYDAGNHAERRAKKS